MTLPEDRRTATPARRSRRIVGRVLAGLLVLLVGAGGAIVVERKWFHPEPAQGQALPTGMSTYVPRNDEERELFKHLRTPNYSEAIGINRSTIKAGTNVAYHVYVATGDLVLPSKPLGEVIDIGLPPGTRWVGGQLTNIRLVAADTSVKSLPLAFSGGDAIFDRWCQTSMQEAFVGGSCPGGQPQAMTEAEMHRNLRPLTEDEIRRRMDIKFVAYQIELTPHNVFEATGDVMLYPYIGDAARAPVIVLGPKARILGGAFGKIQIVGADNGFTRDPRPEILHDPVYTTSLGSLDRGDELCGYFSDAVKSRYPGACPP